MSIKNGMKNGLPIAVAYFPYAVALGLMSKNLGIPSHIIFLMSLLIYAGSSQIIILSLYATTTNMLDLIIPAVLVNARYILINLPIIKKQKNDDMKLKILSSLFLTDEAIAYLTTKKIFSPYDTLGFGFIGYISFCISTLIGSLIGDIIPTKYSITLNFVLYAIFISLLMNIIIENKKYILVVILTVSIKLLLTKLNISPALVILLSITLASGIATIWVHKKKKGDFND